MFNFFAVKVYEVFVSEERKIQLVIDNIFGLDFVGKNQRFYGKLYIDYTGVVL